MLSPVGSRIAAQYLQARLLRRKTQHEAHAVGQPGRSNQPGRVQADEPGEFSRPSWH
jgi:hypothetical protein